MLPVPKGILAAMAGIAALAATTTVAQAHADTAAPEANKVAASAVHLTCSASLETKVSPAVGEADRPYTAEGVGALDDCTSPDGSNSRLRSAAIVLKEEGVASCFEGMAGTGRLTVTWFSGPGRTGTTLGTSVMELRSDGTLPAVTADSQVLAGAALGVQGTMEFVPSSTCTASTPVTGTKASGTVSFLSR
ncbi:hypothetical protein ACF08N_03820 [Streptomyces sp. NPDC015127]|uniref:hypothetical protein n=1 Tax=Streptomyces sp. NPDC015127 TaxID=3364939 RepID=UPI0036FF5E15